MWPLSGSRGVRTRRVTHIWRTTFFFLIFLMLNVPFFFFFYSVSRPLDLCKANKSPWDEKKKKTERTENVINSDLTLGLKGELGKQNKGTDKRREAENGLRQWETLNLLLFHISLTRTLTHTSRVAHIAVGRQRRHSRVSLRLGDGERKEREKRESSCWWGLDRAAPAPHRRITLERTHHLCSFVELSHFNPRPSPLGTDFTPFSTRHGAPWPSHPPTPPKRSAAVSISTSVLLSSGVRYKHFNQSHPNNWPASCLSRTPGGVERKKGVLLFDFTLVCVPYIFTAI